MDDHPVRHALVPLAGGEFAVEAKEDVLRDVLTVVDAPRLLDAAREDHGLVCREQPLDPAAGDEVGVARIVIVGPGSTQHGTSADLTQAVSGTRTTRASSAQDPVGTVRQLSTREES